MQTVAVVYWSGSGNTEAMARAVQEGAGRAGANVSLFTASDFASEDPAAYDGFAFGCPAMGEESLEETEFQPVFDAIKHKLGGNPVVLFGFYGWGTGEWMERWKQDCQACGISLAADPVIVNGAPDADGLAQCSKLGAALLA